MAVYGPWITTVLSTYLTGKTVKAMLVPDTFVQDRDHQFRSSITEEVAGAGYTAGGKVVTGLAVSYDAALDQAKVTCDPVDFGVVTIASIGAVVFYVNTGSATTDVLIAVDDFEGLAADNQNVTYTPSADGIIVGLL